jgi:hypothetical protein
MLNTSPELRISLWSGTASATEQLTAHIHALAPNAQVGFALSENQLNVQLNSGDTGAAAALDKMLQHEIDTLVYSYRWYGVGKARL